VYRLQTCVYRERESVGQGRDGRNKWRGGEEFKEEEETKNMRNVNR
jgi:hypothetical protein